MSAPLSQRCSAEAIEQFGDDLAALNRKFDQLCDRMPSWMVDRLNCIAGQDMIEMVAEGLRKLGDTLCRELDAAEETDDRRRDNPFALDHRRLGQ